VDAFRTAAVTLESRSKIWGAHSTELADWIKGQDAVFSNCGSGGYSHLSLIGEFALH